MATPSAHGARALVLVCAVALLGGANGQSDANTECPSGSTGSNVAAGCACDAGHYGTISRRRSAPFYTGSCAACAAGQSSDVGSTSSSNCAECSEGQYAPAEGSGCLFCAPGQYSTAADPATKTHCIDCAAGRFTGQCQALPSADTSIFPNGQLARVDGRAPGYVGCYKDNRPANT
eukprot:SAG22_NODE_2872_length_2136_cov_9.188022_2_plen_175_part_01